jgi:hypothetical protein
MVSLLPKSWTQATFNNPKNAFSQSQQSPAASWAPPAKAQNRVTTQQVQKILTGTSTLEFVLSKLAQLGSLLKAVFNPKTPIVWQTTGHVIELVLERPSQTLITLAKIIEAAAKLFKKDVPARSTTVTQTTTGGFQMQTIDGGITTSVNLL